jgi:triosephosphate isomerase (TIM)
VSRTAIIAGNWKMHGTAAKARELAAGLVRRLASSTKGRKVVIAPPFTSLAAAAEAVRGSTIEIGAQNVHWEASGAFTGEISAGMLVEVGCRWVIVGHSERRQHFGETDVGVGRRARAALAAGLQPIICVGETLEERDDGLTLDVVRRQTRAALLDLDAAAIRNVCIAYEPVWAVGTGRAATPAQAEEVHAKLREVVAELTDGNEAQRLRILYGGSVKPENIDALMAQPDIDGALVGGASLDVESFARIVEF